MNCDHFNINIMYLKIRTSLELLLVVLSVITALSASMVAAEIEDTKVVDTYLPSRQVKRVRFVWNLKNFDLNDFVNHQAINSTTLSSDYSDNDYQWYLKFFPKGDSTTSKESASLYIYSLSSNVTASISLGFINSKNEETNKKVFLFDFTKNSARGYDEFVKQDDLINPKNGLLVNGTLTIFCDITTIVTI